MSKPYRLYLFDVDGTLTDSAPDICAAVDVVLSRRQLTQPKPSYDQVRSYIGKHLAVLFGDLFPGITPAEVDALILEYRAEYLSYNHAGTRLYDGVAAALPRIPGLRGTATTKGTVTTRSVLEKFELLPHFHHVQGTDNFPPKPAPDVVLRGLEHFGVAPQDCLFVGDSESDMAAGRAAGVNLCAVRYGYGNLDRLLAYQPEHVISSLEELVP